jgi:hypothetical protein
MRRSNLRSLSQCAFGLVALVAVVSSGEWFLHESSAGAREPSEAPKPIRKTDAPKKATEKTPQGDTASTPIGGVDYSKFKLARSEPLRVPRAAFALCRPPSDFEGEKQRGPHFAPAVKFFANDQALTQLRSGKASTMPVGATIVKEKWDDERAKTPVAYAAMIKREAGYDPKHGDWEYVYAKLDKKGAVERGRLKSCIDCHATAEKRDYLFRNWLDAKANDAKPDPTPVKSDAEKRAVK